MTLEFSCIQVERRERRDGGLAEYLADIETRVEKVGENIEPDGDWISILCVEDCDDDAFILGPLAFGNPSEKAFVFQVLIPAALDSLSAVRFAVVATFWSVKVEGKDAAAVARVVNEVIPPSKHPDRAEVVAVYAFDADERIGAFASVVRSNTSAPRLGPWESYGDGAGVSGNIPDLWGALPVRRKKR